jgi:diacylglycerol kinase family enzyme
MRRLALIANPMAGALSAPTWVERARRELWGYEIESFLPSSTEELQELGARFLRKDYAAALVIGGDGTQNQALRGRWNSQASSDELAPLYPFPGGTANDLSAELGLTRSLEQVQRLIDRSQDEAIDVISVNGVPFTTVAGIGVGAALTQAINDTRRESKVFCGLLRTLRAEIYTAMSAKTILTSRGFLHDVKIESDAFSERLKVAAVFVCNQDRLGGNLKVGERNSNRDGVFGVLVIPGKNPAALLKDLALIKSGRTPSGAIRFSTQKLTVSSQQGREIPVFGDGEILLQHSRLHFEIHPRALSVFSEGSRS